MAEQRITRGKRVWNKSVAAYLQALHDHQEFMSDCYHPASKAMADGLGGNPTPDQRKAWMERCQIDRLEAEGDRLANIISDSLRRLMKCPTPAYADLITKMEIAHRIEFTRFYDAPVLFELMLQDLKRLVHSP